jgi:UDP-glucose 4-epimerase
MSSVLLWVIGGGGLLGSHLSVALRRHFPRAELWQSTPLHFSWHDTARLAAELENAVAAFATAARERATAWAVLWCAGKGVISSAAVALEPEWLAWTRLLELLNRVPAAPEHALPGAVFLASSAGALYRDDRGEPLTEDTPLVANSAYGAHKLRMEEALRGFNAGCPNVSCLIGRISTLYGPGQDLEKAQGIISRLSQCLVYRRPVDIYVSLDTRRDYLFVDDCAHEVAASTRRLLTERPGTVTKIFASEELTSLARIVGVFFRMAKHRPLIVCRQPRGAQPVSLKFRSQVWRNLQGLRKTDLATGIHLVHEHQLDLFRQGRLPAPSQPRVRLAAH